MPQAAYRLCRHTKTDGLRCQSPAQGVSAFCYHHGKLPRGSRRRPARENSAIRQTMDIVARQTSAGLIDHYQANVMLRALDYASNLHRTRTKSRS